MLLWQPTAAFLDACFLYPTRKTTVVIVNWSDYVVKLREHADSKRSMDDNSFFLLLSLLLSSSLSLSSSSLLLLLVFYYLRAIAQPNLSTELNRPLRRKAADMAS